MLDKEALGEFTGDGGKVIVYASVLESVLLVGHSLDGSFLLVVGEDIETKSRKSWKQSRALSIWVAAALVLGSGK